MINSKTVLVTKGNCESFSCEILQGPHFSHNHGWNVKDKDQIQQPHQRKQKPN